MQIDNDTIEYLENLSYLTLSDGERQHLRADLEKILSGMEQLKEVDTSGVPERSHPFDNVNAFREDEAGVSFERELILRNAPVHNDESFVVPKTVE